MDGLGKNNEQLNVSQLELIKRLHRTGIKAQTLIKALDSLERQRDAARGTDSRPKTADAQGTEAHRVGGAQSDQNVPTDTALLLLRQLATVARHEQCQQHSEQWPHTSAEEAESGGRRRTSETGTEAHRTSPKPWQEHSGHQPTSSAFGPTHAPPTSSSSGRPIRSQRTPMKEIITLDDPTELDEFMARGEEQCIHAMRAFITQFSLRQTTVATMTGVSQPYISKLLNGNHRELSLRCRKNIYCWYLNCRRHPEKLAMFVQDPCTRLETSAEGELVPQRRERYVFRPVLLRLLETYFQECPFPDIAKRVEIANACNAHLQVDKRGAQLMPKEVVTPQVIANWFANKRKEMRRRMGGTGAELGRSRLNSLSAGRSNSPSSPHSAAHSQEGALEPHQNHGNVDEALLSLCDQRQTIALPVPVAHNQQQMVKAHLSAWHRPFQLLISDQPESLPSAAADFALLLPPLGPLRHPNCCPPTAPPAPQSVLCPAVEQQLVHLLQAQPLANQLLLLQQLLSSADNDYLKQDQQHLLMAIQNQ